MEATEWLEARIAERCWGDRRSRNRRALVHHCRHEKPHHSEMVWLTCLKVVIGSCVRRIPEKEMRSLERKTRRRRTSRMNFFQNKNAQFGLEGPAICAG
jgi:hypothetical protein